MIWARLPAAPTIVSGDPSHEDDPLTRCSSSSKSSRAAGWLLWFTVTWLLTLVGIVLAAGAQ